ncbi:DNA glycosylase AlkZ-like family protein [Jatrophihabitans lederbergiae]|uniref:Crosslink repair DNA glycosylase YcaQ family protein n=1 Tax=Jatrophihabitans lederbergiae TaxID=3075547 RepID=A0ABU2JDQ1_9ACTN|nr:crosslink repair DNA glycosylase YcaQ family protein [Jatrophihabitans sp. DSM 44399]MDT0263118.1 crosslink repair DNA glycosylase YcaQ family protein [Jatrophihabitans sp. DSM 44399]
MTATAWRHSHERLTRDHAAHIAIAAQFGGTVPVDSAITLRRLGLLQLDPLQPVAKAHRLTTLARLPRQTRVTDIDEHLWSAERPAAFETWVHAACLVPIEDWPLFRLARDRSRAAKWQPPSSVLREVLAVIANPEGAVIGDIEKGGTAGKGWNWSERKRAVEYLLRCGDVVCSARRATKRVYHLAEQRLPGSLLAADLSDVEILAEITRKALHAMGIATAQDIATYYNLTKKDVAIGLEATNATPIHVDGWDQPGWVTASPHELDDSIPDHPLLIGPFDNLIWDRHRTRRVFGFDYTFEAYKPVAKRQYGYYVMVVLHQGRLAGRADLKRQSDTIEVLAAQPEEPSESGEFFGVLNQALGRLQDQVNAAPVKPRIGDSDALVAVGSSPRPAELRGDHQR